MGEGAVCKAQRDARPRYRSIPAAESAKAVPEKWCGRDARVPGWASTTQECGAMIYITPRNGARGCLQGPKRATAPLQVHPSGGVGQGLAGKRCGRPARNLIPGWRSRSGSARLPSGSHPCRRERQWPVRMKGKAPLPFHPSGGVGQGCAGKWCGRDARVPGWASTTQECGAMIYVTPGNGARGCLQGAKRRKAPLPFHPSGAVGQGRGGKRCGRDARGPGWASSTQQTGNMIYVTPRNGARGRLQGSRRAKAPLPFHPSGGVGQGCAGKKVRAGRPRSRVGINHTTMRDHGLHPAQEWGTGLFASLRSLPPVRGSGKGRSPPGNAGVPPATLFLAGGREASAQGCGQATCRRREPQRQGPRRRTAPPPGTRASRPQPYFWLEVTER